MDKTFYPDNCIVLDGRLDDPVWQEIPEGTGFTTRKISGGELVKDQTFVKILPCENYVYFGIKCMESNMPFVTSFVSKNVYQGSSVELFLSPSNSTSELYNFALTIDGLTKTTYFVESGNNKEAYYPHWNHAVFVGEDFWSVEIAFPLTAFYHTPNEKWSGEWLVNVIRNQPTPQTQGPTQKTVFICSTWSEIEKNFLEAANFQRITGMPIRPLRNDIKFTGVSLDLNEVTNRGFCGTLTVSVVNAVADTFTFSSDFSDPVTVFLPAGANTVKAPCCVKELIRYTLSMELKRAEDGDVFRFYSPIAANFEPIRITFTQPEYRTNFYPGQDYTKIVGRVLAGKPVTLTLEGGGMKKQVITPDAEGNFVFLTPDFQVGEAILTAAIEGFEVKKTMRRLAPTGHTMAWISGGRLVVNGKPVLRRNVFAPYYRGGEAFDRRYAADNLHETTMKPRYSQPRGFIRNSETRNATFAGEATQDRKPSEEMLEKMDALIESSKDMDYVYHYAYDEPEYHSASLVYMRHYYEALAEKDPYHPILIATHNPDRYLPFCDWVETDPYLGIRVYKTGRTYLQPINTLHTFLDPVVQLNRPDKCIGFINTCFAYKSHAPEADYPTFDELNCHTWVAINHGAQTMWSYAYHDLNDRPRLYEGTRYVFGSLEALEDVILYGTRKTLLRTGDIDTVLFENGEDTMFVAANMSSQPQSFTLDGIDGVWHHFRHGRTLTGNVFALKPFEVLIGTRLKKDENLPSYQDTATLIDRLEAERSSNQSLLFELEQDVEITASEASHSKHKLFDGVRDNLAKKLLEANSFIELNLTKVKPTFRKIVVSGWHLEDMKIMVRNHGELTALTPVQTENKEFRAAFLLEEAVCPDALRFVFPQQNVELYEIEIFENK